LPGNPNAISAALASGRFPGVFAPYPVEDIYPAGDPENDLLYGILANWFDDPQVKSRMAEAWQAIHTAEAEGMEGPEEKEKNDEWERVYSRWRTSRSMREYFPTLGDGYVDGGAIDNTPSNSGIDATREWAESIAKAKRDVALDLFVVFLEPEPLVRPVDVEDPALYQVVQRTLEIQGVAKQSADAVVVDTINTFGKRGERLGDTLLLVLDSYQETLRSLDQDERRAILDRLLESARERALRGYLGAGGEGILERMEAWAQDLVDDRLPLQVDVVRIYPEAMPLGTLQFTERLGYREENGIAMLTMGCHNTLWALRAHLEGQSPLDAHDRQVLALARKWMGFDTWPEEASERETLRSTWRCQRSVCIFHPYHCPHGECRSRP
jgi:hypothetical protein